jgi:hypothetical protein
VKIGILAQRTYSNCEKIVKPNGENDAHKTKKKWIKKVEKIK